MGYERLFPSLLASRSPNLFSLDSCRFGVSRERVATARVGYVMRIYATICYEYMRVISD
jgi:hypothetical protein